MTPEASFPVGRIEANLRKVEREAIRAEGDRVVAYLAENPAAREELEDLGTPQSDMW